MSSKLTTGTGDSQDADGDKGRLLRELPSIDSILNDPKAGLLEKKYGRRLLLDGLRSVVEECRLAIQEGASEAPSSQSILDACDEWLRVLLSPSLVPVINASGVVVHTNLGRAPLNQKAASAVVDVATSYSNLEYDNKIGRRGSRAIHAEELLTRLTGAEAVLVVNNNAAAVLLMLTALCNGREVIISRSQLVEIGGGFRIPDVMVQSGARLVEVGTTNRTHLTDYSQAITEKTAALFVAHHSNFKIIGFTSEPALAEIAQIAREHHLYSLYDQGSGALLDTSSFGLDHEPTVGSGLLSGMDIVTFSGDKLLGGPQAGILCGKRELISQIKRHPLARAVRVDKMALAALTSTLQSYLTGRVTEEIPVWQMISQSKDTVEVRAKMWQQSLQAMGVRTDVIDGESAVGGGSLPGTTTATSLLAISNPNVSDLAAGLRNYHTPVVARIAEGRLLLDPRTVLPGQDDLLLKAIVANVKMSS